MNRQLVTHLGISLAVAIAAAAGCIASGGGVLLALAAYSLAGSATLTTVCVVVAYAPLDVFRRRRAAAERPERVYA